MFDLSPNPLETQHLPHAPLIVTMRSSMFAPSIRCRARAQAQPAHTRYRFFRISDVRTPTSPLHGRCHGFTLLELLIVVGIIASLLFALAVSASPTPAPRRPPHTKKVDESDKQPFVGMTKTQAQARYGKPNHKTSTPDGEQWTYILNMGQSIGKHMIPFFVSTQTLRTGVLTFGPDSSVKTFTWDPPEG